jgi:hypothetical protein
MALDPAISIGIGIAATLVSQQAYRVIGSWLGVEGGTNGKITLERVRALIKETHMEFATSTGQREILTSIESAKEREIAALIRIETTNAQIRDACIGIKSTAETTLKTLIDLLAR